MEQPDKTQIACAPVISRYLVYIEELYKVLENNIDRINIDQKHLNQIWRKYKKYKQERGAEAHIRTIRGWAHKYD